MKATVQIIQMGDDLGFVLPSELVRKFDLKDGDFIDSEAVEKGAGAAGRCAAAA